MPAIVTDQFRILNAGNFVDSVLDTNNSYYVFLGLPNPATPSSGFGRTDTESSWNTNTLNPVDNLQNSGQFRDAALFGKKVTSANVRRLIRRVNWSSNTRYDMYRHDYSNENPAPNSNLSRLYDANYYVINSDFRVYICIDNGSSGDNLKGNPSKDEPTFTDLEPTAAGTSGDGYVWKYLFSVAPSDIIKFDSTEYVVVPNEWETSTDDQIQNIREAGNSDINLNQIKKIYIADGGENYKNGVVDILGDGTGGKVSIVVAPGSGKITSAVVVSGGSGYTFGVVDLGKLQPDDSIPSPAKLIPIIPPSKGHGYNIYTELGTDKVLVYARFDDSSKDFPIDTKFCQVGIIKNPTQYTSDSIFTGNDYSSLFSVKISSFEKIVFNHENSPSMPVKTAILMSCALPPIFKPIAYDNDFYLDGGMLCNYPINDCILKYPSKEDVFGLHVTTSKPDTRASFSDDSSMPDLSLIHI